MQEYADPVIDWLDAGRGILSHRMFRDVSVALHTLCTQLTAICIVLYTIT